MSLGLQLALEDYHRLFGLKAKPQSADKSAGTIAHGPLYLWPTQETAFRTTVLLRRGQRFRILAAGETPIDRGRTWVSPDGLIRRGPGTGTQPFYHGAQFPDFPLGALLARVSDGEWFQVEFLTNCEADAAGYLCLVLNDTPGRYYDNVDAGGREVPLAVYVLVEE